MSLFVAKSGIVAGFLVTALFQTPAAPPIKMGLWETSSTVKMNIPNMPFMGPRSNKVHSCLTPESYAKGVANAQQKDCMHTNVSITDKGYSFDLSCRGGKETGHFEMIFDSPEATHGTMHLSAGNATISDSTFTASFVSTDCGGITPDKPQVVH
jgi:hypothetical protein